MTAILYPPPPGEPASPDFEVRLDGQPAFVYQARVSARPINQVWPGYQRPMDQTELASFAYFDLAGPVQIEIVARKPVETVTVRPLSFGIRPAVDGQSIAFSIDHPQHIVVEVNDWHNALHLFASPPETWKPDPADPKVHYYDPGIHQAGKIALGSDEILYLAGGAVVHGVVSAEGASNLRILGRGILDASQVQRFDAGPMIHLKNCHNAHIEGVICRDPHVWTVKTSLCKNIWINDIKLIGEWRYNADGIDICNTQNVLIENCFVRSFDDSLVVKGLDHNMDRNGPDHSMLDTRVRNIVARHCVVWNDWGRGLEIGAETQADEMSNILFEDCDIIHYVHRAMDIQHGDRALVRDVRFENIRVEDPITEGAQIADTPHTPDEVGLLAELIIYFSMWNKDPERGRMENIHFKDIQVLSAIPQRVNIQGYDSGHLVEKVVFENLCAQGQRMTTPEQGLFAINEFARNIEIR